MPDQQPASRQLSESDTQEYQKGPVFNRLALYLAGQPFGNFLSFLIICGFAYWFWWSQTIGEDQKAKRLQDAFTVIHSQNAEIIKDVEEKHSGVVKAMLEHAESAGKRREKEGERTEQFLREFVRPMPANRPAAIGREKHDDDGAFMVDKPESSPSGLEGGACE